MAGRRHGDPHLAAVLDERQRVEVRGVAVEAPPGTRQVVGRAAHRAAQHRAVDLGRVEGVGAGGAGAAVGVELLADPAHDQLDALDLERARPAPARAPAARRWAPSAGAAWRACARA